MSDEIAIRAYTIKTRKKNQDSWHESDYKKITVFDRILVFDTETSVDLYQNLKFGYFHIYQYDKPEEQGLFYDPIIKPKEKAILQKYSDKNKIHLYTIEEFRKIFLHEVYELETLCIGFNLPFDLTRIAIRTGNGRRKKKDAFSLEISKSPDYPRLHITHATNTLAFIEWGTLKNKAQKFRGNFADLRTLSHALTDEKHSLESACKAFDTRYKKYKAKKHGIINPKYIKYCINDVQSTYSLYQNAKKEFDTYNLDISVTKAYTPASIGKSFLKLMGVHSFIEKNPTFPNKVIGNIMTGYFGGRTENKIRKTPTLIDLLDFLSMYPTVCILQGLWKFVIADHIEYVDATQEIIQFIDNFSLQDLRNRENWTKLPAIVLVEPQDDVLPIRARFGQKHVWNIGICHVTSKTPLWYSLADVLASKLSTGKTPKILQALRFVPVGVQTGLKEIEIHGVKINPYKQDLFKELIEYRDSLKKKRDSFPKNNPQYLYYERKQNVIKIITNAISYGIFVEINTHEELHKVPIHVYGLTHFVNQKTKVEKAGFMLHPIIGTSITSASRLLLAATEVILSKHGRTHAYCDTDSMAIPSEHTKEVQEFFQPLNPYSFNADIFKLERKNIWFYGISSKRYCLYTIKDGKIKIKKNDYSSHGLGHLLDPFTNDPDNKIEWHKIIWKDILDLHYENTSIEKLVQKYESKYALSQLSISSPKIQGRFREFNKNKDYHKQVKGYSFAILGYYSMIDEETSEPIKPLAPYKNPAKHAVSDYFVDYNNKTRKLKGKQYWKTFWETFREYLRNAESKFEGDIGVLQRKHVTVSKIVHIGKESNNLDESEILGLDSDSYQIYEDHENINLKFEKFTKDILKLNPRDVKKFEISKQTLWNVKKKIRLNQLNRISFRIKTSLLELILK